MKKLTDWKSLKVGGVFNRVYVGDNEAYAKINGKETFRVLQMEPELQIVILFGQFGSVTTRDLQSNAITYSNPSAAFKDFELYKPSNQSEWFKKSVKVNSLKEARRFGVTMAEIKRDAEWSVLCPFVACMGGPPHYRLRCVSDRFNVEGKVKNQPFLQSVFVVWKTWKQLETDFKRLRIRVRT